jgi:hypothetical protein
MSISFTTTATCRPEILRETLRSFNENLRDLDFSETTLYINIDPLPDASLQEDTLEIARGHFGRVHHRFTKKGNFTAAVNWLWDTAPTDYVFHLEDDWRLDRPVSINELLSHFEDPNVMQVALRAYPYDYKKLCLSPSVLSSKITKRFAGKLDESVNPEVQLRADFVKPEMIRVVGSKPVIFDIGRKWLEGQGLSRGQVKNHFTTWS